VKVFRFVAARKAEHSVKTMCRVLGVSRSGFHAWERRPACRRELDDRELVESIKRIHARSRQTYGARRIHAELAHDGVRVGRKRVERLMRQAALSGLVKRSRGRTTVRVAGVRCAPDLVARDFRPPAPDRLWVADITYVRTWEGWLYLAAVVDCYSRRVVGWSVADHMRAELVVDALEMAVSRRKPDAGLVHHSDQGSQFVSLVFGQRCRDIGIEVSMGSKGCCFDNAVAESFFKTLKGDLIHRRSWPTKAEARTAIFEWIEVFYNRQRLHSTLGYLSPVRYEEQSTLSRKMIEEAA
jgi:putative transposase